MEMMKCVKKTVNGPGGLVLTTAPIPEIEDNEILVKVQASAVCGSDNHIDDWNDWAAARVKAPVIIGHEFAGEVVKIGSKVTTIQVGNIVSAETHVICNTCELCQEGNGHVCYNTSTIGVHRNGSFAEYIAIPEDNAFVCDPSIPIEVSSMMEPLGAAVHTVMEYPVATKTIVISGCGPIGCMAVAVAKKVGAAKVIAVEPNEYRAKMAMDMGADVIVNPMKEKTVDAIKALTGGKGADVVLEFSGVASAVRDGIESLRPEGKMAALGLPSKPVEFNMGEFVYRGLELKGIAGRLMYTTWHQMQGLLNSGLDISKIVTHVLPLDQYEEGLRLMKSGECGKVILKP